REGGRGRGGAADVLRDVVGQRGGEHADDRHRGRGRDRAWRVVAGGAAGFAGQAARGADAAGDVPVHGAGRVFRFGGERRVHGFGAAEPGGGHEREFLAGAGDRDVQRHRAARGDQARGGAGRERDGGGR